MKLIYLELEEEITSVIDKLGKVSDAEVTLVLPKRANLIQSIINLKLLKKHASMLGKDIVLVTSDSVGVNLAKRAGLRAQHRVDAQPSDEADNQEISLEKKIPARESAKRSGKKVGVKKIKSYKQIQKDGIGIKKIAGASFQKGKKKDLPKEIALVSKRRIAVVLVMVLVVLVGVAGYVYFYLPKATVTLFLKTDKISNDAKIMVKRDAESYDKASNIIHGEIYEVEKEGTKKRETSGKKQVGLKAQGTITIYNNYQTTPRTIVKSRFQAPEGKIFWSMKDVTLPGYTDTGGGNKVPGIVTVSVEAEKPGEEYNIGAAKFILPALDPTLQKDIYAESSTAMVGGKSEEVRVVSGDDLKKVEEELARELAEKVVSDFLSKDRIIFSDGCKIETLDYSPSKAKEEEAADFELKLKLKFTFLSFKEDDVKKVSQDDIREVVPSDKFLIKEGEKNLSYDLLKEDIDHGKMEIMFHEEKMLAKNLDKTRIKEEIKGLDEQAVRKVLSKNEDIENVKIEFWPFWVKKISRRDNRVDIKLRMRN
ncbi:MAG: hypothetical protein ACD_63C00106G0002 [uncultured bacterium]|nr:MAG: hypothetical protein ACD_63C00106G0002 [uncultured bacterium]